MKDYTNQVQELTNNPYRFSDVFSLGIPETDIILNDPRYAESILAEYLTTKKRDKDISTLKEVTNRHSQKYSKPDENELVFHLRLGDAGWDQFNFIDELDKYIHKDQFSKITVVTALHFGNRNENYSRSNYTEGGGITWKRQKHLTYAWDFLYKLENKINSIGYDLNIYSHKNVDKDICYMTQSNYFVPHYRRFSALMLALLNDKAEVLIVGKQAQECLDVLSNYNQFMFPHQPVKIPKKMTSMYNNQKK